VAGDQLAETLDALASLTGRNSPGP
jgi:hypothetical protein